MFNSEVYGYMKHYHGGRVYDKYVRLDFSININPLGMPDIVKKAIIESVDNLETYPDTECLELRGKIAEVEKVPFKNIVCGNGADDIIFRAAQALEPNHALILSPTFSEYENSLRGCDIRYYPLKESSNFKVQPDILQYLEGIDTFYLCNPNNPTGALLDGSLMGDIVCKCIEKKVTLIVDESFLDFTTDGKTFKEYLNRDINLIILKAFTKIYSMAGIRLGYAICSNSVLCNKIFECGQAWSVSTIAQVCGISALKCTEYVEDTKTYVQNERKFLASQLTKLGIRVFPSDTNYLLVKSQLDLYDLLLKENILIRDCSNYVGLDTHYFRVGIKKHQDNLILVDTLKKILTGSDYVG